MIIATCPIHGTHAFERMATALSFRKFHADCKSRYKTPRKSRKRLAL